MVIPLKSKKHFWDFVLFPWGITHPVRQAVSARLISRGTVFFSHNKTTTAGL
jgi:hypothetical protein